MESLARFREPAGFVVFGVLCLQLLLDLVALSVYGSDQVYGTVAGAALVLGGRMPETLTLGVLAALAVSCVAWRPTRNGRLLTMLAWLGGAASVLLALVFAFIGLSAESSTRMIDFFSVAVGLVLPALITVGLLRLWSGVRATSRTGSAQVSSPAALPQAEQLPVQQQPVWQPDAASGVAWHTAGDAAAGAPAAGWGQPGESGGWQPIPQAGQGNPPGGSVDDPSAQPPGGWWQPGR